MTALLVIYTIVATVSAGSSSTVHYDWRSIGAFSSPAACEAAREMLGDSAKPRTRCLPESTPTKGPTP